MVWRGKEVFLGFPLAPQILPRRQRATEPWRQSLCSFLLPHFKVIRICRPSKGLLCFYISQHPAQCFTYRWYLKNMKSCHLQKCVSIQDPQVGNWIPFSWIQSGSSVVSSLFPSHRYMLISHSSEIHMNLLTFSHQRCCILGPIL